VTSPVTERGLAAFLAYARRELSLDASLRAGRTYGRGEEHRQSVAGLRDLNRRTLLRDSIAPR